MGGQVIRDVHLLTTGLHRLSGSTTEITVADFNDIIDASYCPGLASPPLRLGHDDLGGAAPRLGSVTHIRASLDHGDTYKLFGDFAGVPGWLAEAIPDHWPHRSVEIRWDHRCQLNHEHGCALLAVALLGVHPPAVVCDPIDLARQLVADGRD